MNTKTVEHFDASEDGNECYMNRHWYRLKCGDRVVVVLVESVDSRWSPSEPGSRCYCDPHPDMPTEVAAWFEADYERRVGELFESPPKCEPQPITEEALRRIGWIDTEPAFVGLKDQSSWLMWSRDDGYIRIGKGVRLVLPHIKTMPELTALLTALGIRP